MSSNFTLDFPQSDMPISPDRHHNINSKIVYGSLASLFMIVLCILFLHLYFKWIYQRSNRRYASWRRRHGLDFQIQDPLKTGLNKAVVNSLPTFVYKVIQSQMDALECAVCLSEFQEGEKGRLLPKCSHRFHIDCIGTWFLSNTTCPLCRMSAEPISSGSIADCQDESSTVFLTNGREALSQSDSGDEPAIAVAESLQNRVGSLLRRQLSLQASEGRSWRRSISDRFPQISHGVQLPTNVLFWGNHSHVNSRVNSEHWEEGPLPHIVVEVPTSQDTLLTLRSASMSPSPCSSFEDPSCSSPSVQQHSLNRLSTLKRLLSREKKSSLSDQDSSSCGLQG